MKLDPKIGRSLKKASPTILTCIGAAGVVATAVLAVKATPKADSLIKADSRRNHDGDPYAATKLEAVKSCWKCYIPAAATGVATIICIFGANTLNKKQQASLASAYALVNRSYSDYKHKLKELYGEDAHKKIMESIAAEKSSMPPITATGGFSNSSLEFEDANEEQRLFYDSFSKRYFQATISQVLQAEYHINRNMVLGAFVTLNDFYDFLGISHVEGGDVVGWLLSDSMYWIDFDNSKAMVDDGLNGEIPCYVVDAEFDPQPESEWDYGFPAKTTSPIMERRSCFMNQRNIFKLLSLAGVVLGGIGTLLSGWADNKEQEAIIEEKVNEALAARNEEEES